MSQLELTAFSNRSALGQILKIPAKVQASIR
jgi:hypothetical protein